MRKLVIISILIALIGWGTLPAYADQDTDVQACPGTGGYSGTTWSFSSGVPNATDLTCAFASSDATATVVLPLPPPPPPTLVVPPNVPSPPTVDPTCPLCTVFSLIDFLCTPEPGLCDLGLIFSEATPLVYAIPTTPTSLSLSGAGTFSCGNGTLSGTGSLFALLVNEPDFSLTWQATFTGGIGMVTGTATADCFEQGAECGQVKTLGGFIFINDGSSIPGQCNDSAGNSQVGTLLTISP